jgi:hypothetical protein
VISGRGTDYCWLIPLTVGSGLGPGVSSKDFGEAWKLGVHEIEFGILGVV